MENHEINDYILQAKKLLFRTLNCCESQIIPFHNALGLENEDLLRAVTGLAGGVYNRGSTCGVIFGGVLNMAIRKDRELDQWTAGDERALLGQVGDYVTWFEEEFGGCLCRDRTELDFQTIRGKVGLLIPKKAKGCVKQTALSLKYLLSNQNERGVELQECPVYKHCATDVMRAIREQAGTGDETIEQLATVLDGGIGLSGGGCGALAGGIMALGLQFGHEHSKDDAFKFRNIFLALPGKFTKRANVLIDRFEEKYGTLECAGVSGGKFDGFDAFVIQREKCQDLIDWIVKKITSG